MIKPNVRELEVISGRKIKVLDDIIGASLQIGGKGIPHVLVSMGEKGVLYVRDRNILYAKAPLVKTVSTVGSGDSAVAAFAMAYEQGMRTEDILRYCVGISSANVTTLESAVIPMEKAEEMMKKVEIIRY